jgi:hypothetical protein
LLRKDQYQQEQLPVLGKETQLLVDFSQYNYQTKTYGTKPYTEASAITPYEQRKYQRPQTMERFRKELREGRVNPEDYPNLQPQAINDEGLRLPSQQISRDPNIIKSTSNLPGIKRPEILYIARMRLRHT